MDYRNQIVIRDCVARRINNFKSYNYNNNIAKKRRGEKAVEEIVNYLDHSINIDDLSVTLFDEIVCLIADDALQMSYNQFKFHIWNISEMCNLSVYGSRVGTKELFHRLEWDGIYNAYEKEVAYGI